MTRGVAHTATECSVGECSKKPRGRGLCEMHYRRWLKHGDPLVVQALRGMPEPDRFWGHVRRTPTCWLWTSEIVRGYGRFKRSDGSRIMAHRYAYELSVGPIPHGLTIDHLCAVPLCVNPDHLEPVTMLENIQRGWARRRPC